MDHIAYLDAKAAELSGLLAGEKSMIIRGAAGRKMPYGRVNEGDILYLLENDGSGLIKAKARVGSVLNSERMTEEDSKALVEKKSRQTAINSRAGQPLGWKKIPGLN